MWTDLSLHICSVWTQDVPSCLDSLAEAYGHQNFVAAGIETGIGIHELSLFRKNAFLSISVIVFCLYFEIGIKLIFENKSLVSRKYVM